MAAAKKAWLLVPVLVALAFAAVCGGAGRLVLTASQFSDYDGGGSADGLDQVESDGQYAAILAEPWIYVCKL